MRFHPVLRNVSALLFLFVTVPIAWSVGDDVCLGCHSSQDALGDAGPRAANLVVDEKSLAGSPHEGFSCTQCHTDLAADDAPIPHPPKLAPADCSGCHAEAVDKLKTSIHGARPMERPGAKSACSSCHGAHAIRPAADPASMVHPARLGETCAACHAKENKAGLDVAEQWKRSVHGMAALQWDIPDAPGCAACHEPHAMRALADPAEPLNRRNQMNVCASCHPSELKVVLRGAHGKAWQAGNLAAPVCSDCHGAHDVGRVDDRDSRVYASQVSATCGKCHGDPDLATRFGLRPDRVSTYENSYHGKGARWQDSNVANCASCHRYHDVRGADDPASAVHPSNLRATCGQADCHPGANATFAQLPVHAGAQKKGEALLRVVRISYVLIITFTLAFMTVHQALDLRRAFQQRRKHKGHHAHPAAHEPIDPPASEPLTQITAQGGRWLIQRWSARMVVQHFLLALTFLTLVVTGFALEIPASWAEKLGTSAPAVFALRALLHRIAAVLMIATSLYHVWWLARTPRGRREFVAMFPRPIDDLKDMVGSLKYFLGLAEHPPAGRRYTYREKAEYWALVWGTFVMVATGIILWSAAQWHWLLVEVSRIVHTYEAILAFGAIVIWHMFSIQWRPGIGKTHPTWVNGTIPAHLMQEEHAREYQEMVAWYGIDPEKDTPPHGGPREGR